jgi:hypothetical protein
MLENLATAVGVALRTARPGRARRTRADLQGARDEVRCSLRFTRGVAAASLIFGSVVCQVSRAQSTVTTAADATAAAALSAASAAQSAAASASAARAAVAVLAAAAASGAPAVAPAPHTAATSKRADGGAVWAAPAGIVLYGLPILALVFVLLTVMRINRVLAKSPWSLADALSEDVMLPVPIKTETDGAGVKVLTYQVGADNKPILVPQLRASTSRVIALIGMVAIVFLYLGFGTFALFSFGSTGRLPESMREIVTYLVAGLTLFAPYAVNKLANLFQQGIGEK